MRIEVSILVSVDPIDYWSPCPHKAAFQNKENVSTSYSQVLHESLASEKCTRESDDVILHKETLLQKAAFGCSVVPYFVCVCMCVCVRVCVLFVAFE